MSINRRRLEILRSVTLKNKIKMISILEEFKVSDRTIRNDLIQINNYLKKFTDNEVVIKNGSLMYDNIGIFSDTLKTINLNSYILDNNERIILEIYILLVSNDYVTTTYISDLLLVSQSSVFNDIDVIKSKIKNYNLNLDTSPGKGLLIEGKEINIRNLFYNIIGHYFYLINIIENTNFKEPIFSRYLETKNYIYEIIGKIEHKYNIIFSEDSFRTLYNYLIYITHRIRNNRVLKVDFLESRISNISKDIANILEERYKIKINDSEILMINDLIESLEYKYIGDQVVNTIESQFLTRYIIDYVSEKINIPLFMDYKLYESLSFHIERMKNNNHIGNPIDYDEEILNLVVNNKRLYDVVRESLENSDDYFKKSLNDSEIYYIIIYLYISIEKLLNQIIKELKIVIVCNSGIGTSQLMLLKLKDLFGFKNIQTITSRQLNDSFINKSDLILSTVSLSAETSDYIKVSPMITEKDATLITSLIFQIGHKKLRKIKSIKNSKVIFNSLDNNYVEELDAKGIDYYLTRDNVILDVDAKDWRESIRLSGDILLKSNKISKNYIDNMIKNVEDYGPYIVIKKGIALPHAEISEDVKETGFSLIRLKNPVTYDAGKLDPIKYVCALAANEKKNYIKALFDFNNLINNKEFMEHLDRAKDSIEVEHLIKKFIQEK